MNTDALVFGVVQGLTEFLPVSSSGHLGVAKILTGMSEPSLAFDLTLHIATLLAVFLYFARDIVSLLSEWVYGFFNRHAWNWPGWRFGWAVILGTLITGPIGILLKPFSQNASMNLLWLGGNFWVTALLLFSARFIPAGEKTVRPGNGLLVGLLQGIAVMPGISRSGSTIWAGLVSGLSRDEAFRFSFLLSIPAILGATLLEARELGGYEAFLESLPQQWFLSAFVAFVFGMLSLVILRKLVTSDKWWVFSLYCMLLGTIAVIYSLIGA